MTDLSMFELTGKKALITGAAGGIGRACATALVKGGADVAIVDLERSRAAGEKTCETLRKMGAEAFFLPCDVSDKAQIEAMTAEVVRRFGRIDIGVNNAGVSGPGNALDMTLEDWNRVFAINVTGVWLCAQAQAKQMKLQTPAGGKIINTASMYGAIAGGNVAYNTSKAAVLHLTRSLAKEWGPENINVNCISPGWLLSPGNRGMNVPETRARAREITPMGSMMRYEDMYGAVLYLASSASDFITGQEIRIDGGHTLNTWLRPLTRNQPPRTTPEDEESGMNYDLGL